MKAAIDTRTAFSHVALLRGINVGGHARIAMADLRRLLANAGLADPQTLLQSGNVIFRSRVKTSVQLERTIETAIVGELGMTSDVVVRTAEEWQQIIERNPFPREAKSDPGHLLVMILKDSPAQSAVKALQKSIVGRETVRADGRQAYFYYPDGVGTSKLTNRIIEKSLGTRGTARNWNTARKIQELFSG